jgi:5-formyltetrahydrofolate cyclo-ligase
MTKSELREYYLKKRKEFSEQEIIQKSHEILLQLKKMDIWNYQCFHLFQSILSKNEVQTQELLKELFSLKKQVLVPKVEGLEMLNCEVNPKTIWTKGKFNVPEPLECKFIPPSKIEVVFIPLLIADKKGNRIGYGGGFYDRFLAKCPKNTLKIGLNFFPPILEIQDVEAFDIPLNYCVTPDEIVSFTP